MDVEFERCYKDGKLWCSSAHTHTHTREGCCKDGELGRAHTHIREVLQGGEDEHSCPAMLV